MTNNLTPEQRARDMLERLDHPDAQSLSAGELVELANLIAENEQLRSDISQAYDLRDKAEGRYCTALGEIERLKAALQRIGNSQLIYSSDEDSDENTQLSMRMADARATLKGCGGHEPKPQVATPSQEQLVALVDRLEEDLRTANEQIRELEKFRPASNDLPPKPQARRTKSHYCDSCHQCYEVEVDEDGDPIVS